MTLLEREPAEGLQVARKAVLKTARLMLRAPRPDDAKAIKALINDRRVAENMATIPHPYTLKDARSFIANAAGKPLFVITRDDGRLIGGGGIGAAPAGLRDRLLDRRPVLGQRLRHRSRPRPCRPCLPRSRPHRAARRCAGDQPGVAARAGEVRLPVDRRGAAAGARAQRLGAVRPVPARSRPLARCDRATNLRSTCRCIASREILLDVI